MNEELFSQNGLSLERLRAFAEIVGAGGPTSAAKGDSTRQSQYSRQLKELEEFFGTELFVRRDGRWVLTVSGRNLYQLNNEYLGALNDFLLQCGNEPVALRIGAGESFFQWRLLPCFKKLRQEMPETRLILLNRRSDDVAAALIAGDLEFGILPRSKVTAKLKWALLPRVEYQLFVPSAICEAIDDVEIDWALRVPFVLLEGNGVIREALTTEAARRRLDLNVVLECSSHLQIAEVVRQGHAAAVLPTGARVAFPSDSVKVHSLPCLRTVAQQIVCAWNTRLVRTRPIIAKSAGKIVKILSN